jgi:hypothetical protein
MGTLDGDGGEGSVPKKPSPLSPENTPPKKNMN